MSVAEIKFEKAYENGAPKSEGISDRRLGSNGAAFPCLTCNCDDDGCPGHFGHVELAKPMFNIGFFSTTLNILRCVCHYCSRLLASEEQIAILLKIRRRSTRMRTAVSQLNKPKRKCDGTNGCGHEQPKYQRDGFRIRASFDDGSDEASTERYQTISAEKTYAIFKRVSNRDVEAFGLSPLFSRPEWFILTLLPVPPPQVRPSVMQGGMRNEDDLTNKLTDIVKHNNALSSLESTGSVTHAIREQIDLLQYHVATYMNNEMPGIMPSTVRGGSRPIKSIGQRFKGKEGRVRGNLMGKRVDFSARTVITPDPNLKLHEVGVPRSIALNLTFPETVTSFNMKEMQRLVAAGPEEYPGAKYIEREDGQRINLEYIDNRSEIQLDVGFKVIRHIHNGDYVLFNRQPSLHKMSIMGHRIRVLPYSTFRLNLSVTSPYNADFDGDEMNLHVPQSHQTRAEVQELMLVPHCIVSPQSNKPVMGIIQDTLLGCMLFTQRDTFLERDFVMNMLMHVDEWDGVVPHPAILKPRPLWTGKQIFSLILPAVNLTRTNITHPDDEDTPISPGDTRVHIANGELLCGIVDKKTVGSSANGLIHVTWKEFGARRTDQLISRIQVLVNHYVLHRGQSIGIGDTIADDSTMKDVIQRIQGAKQAVKLLIRKAQKKELPLLPGKSMMESFETEVNKELNQARDKSGSSAQTSLLKSNNIKRMVSAGSKGSFINISQICACVGQQNVEGRRIGYGFNRRTLPHFVVDDLAPESRGFVENSYLRGLTPTEFFFHAMGGREGLIDTAVKTAETGYIQRRLIKAMEDINVRYDGTVRNSVNQVVEFLYGEDGMDATYLEDQVLHTVKLKNNRMKAEYFLDPAEPRFGYDERDRPYLLDDIRDHVRQDAQLHLLLKAEYDTILADRELLRDVIIRTNSAKRPLAVNVDRVIMNAKQMNGIQSDSVSNLSPDQVLKGVKMLLKRTRVLVLGDEIALEDAAFQTEDDNMRDDDDKDEIVDPIAREAQENATLLFQIHIRASLCCKKLIVRHRLNMKAFLWVLGEIESRFLSSKVSPGENIGAVAAQSIGEPATQMTLNTFHYAGVSAKNVTLGVPRLKELINVSKNVKTPSLTVFLKRDCAMDMENAKKVQAQLQHTTLRDVTKMTEIYYDPEPQSTVVEEDEEMIENYFEIEEAPVGASPWLLRVTLDSDMLQDRGITMQMIETAILTNFGSDLHVIRSDDNDKNTVVRLRMCDDSSRAKYGEDGGALPEDDDEMDAEDADDDFLRRLEVELLSKMDLGGVHSIKKVFMRQSKEKFVNEATGTYEEREEWVLDTEGVNLAAVLAHEEVDSSRTISNDVVEIFTVLGIEAAREALMLEIGNVISFDGSYVNHRHLGILVDSMTYRGHLMAITRHGVNRVETGPLMKCSFEETTDMLLEGAILGEKDELHGVTENIMMGQLAPIGTGSFKLLLNEKMLKEAIEPEAETIDSAMASGESPRQAASLEHLVISPGRSDDARRRQFDARATPGMAYSPSAWATPGRMTPGRTGTVRGNQSPHGSGVQFSPIANGAQFSPTPGTPSGGGRGFGHAMTPIMQSPRHEYGAPMSPGGAMSPYHGAASPGPTASPGYINATSPGYVASPGRGGGIRGYGMGGVGSTSGFAPSSPAYQLTSPGPSAMGMAQSPRAGGQYSPTSPGFSPASPAFSPAGGGRGDVGSYSPSSPGFAGGTPASPAANAYAVGGTATGRLAYSPSSPAAFGASSPGAFSPSSPAGDGYSPSTPAFAGQSPAPYGAYQPGRGRGLPLPQRGRQTGAPGQPNQRSPNAHSPSSPQYSPSSPQYSPSR